MGAMTDWYKEYQMGIVDEDTFDLDKEYEIYYNNEANSIIDRAKFAANAALNNIRFNGNKKLISTANRLKAAEIGTEKAANKLSNTVMSTYGKPDRKELVDSYDNYKTKKQIESKYRHKLKRAEDDISEQQPSADNRSKQPVFRPAYT